MNKTSARLAVARNIRFFRTANQFTNRELAKRIDVCSASISAYETGRCVPSLDVIFRLADVFDVSVSALLVEPSITKSEISLAEAIQAIIDHNAQIPAMHALTESLAATIAQYKVREGRRELGEIR
jgi:transcriptional regulator with XRE-family HTH domain